MRGLPLTECQQCAAVTALGGAVAAIPALAQGDGGSDARSEHCWCVGWHSPGSPQTLCLLSGNACPPMVTLPCVVALRCSLCAPVCMLC